MKTPRTFNFINQFALGHQLACQAQQSHNYNVTDPQTLDLRPNKISIKMDEPPYKRIDSFSLLIIYH